MYIVYGMGACSGYACHSKMERLDFFYYNCLKKLVNLLLRKSGGLTKKLGKDEVMIV